MPSNLGAGEMVVEDYKVVWCLLSRQPSLLTLTKDGSIGVTPAGEAAMVVVRRLDGRHDSPPLEAVSHVTTYGRTIWPV